MKVSERMILKQRLKRLGLFCLIVLIPICFLAFGLMYAGLSQAWNIVITVCVLFLLFGLFMVTCSALDKRGSVLIDQEAQTDILSSLSDEDFYSEAHRNIFKAMQNIFSKSIPVDFVTLTSELEVEKKLESVGGIDYITYLTNVVPSAANFKHYCDIVTANSVRRNLIRGGQKIIEDAFQNADEQSAMQNAEKIIFDLSQKDTSSGLELVGKPGGVLTDVLKEISEIAENQGKMRGIPSGFRDLDAITNGLNKSDLILLAARPGVGKTSFAMNIALNVALNEGKKVAIFALEMSRSQLVQRALASLAKVNLTHILRGTMDQEEWKRIWTAEKKLAQSSLFIDDNSTVTPLDIISKCRKLKMTEGLDLIVIDYLQLMTGMTKTDNRQQEISEITRYLKITAKELNVPIILLSQLSRAIEQRKDHKPMLSDLRESGAIEQDADIVLFIDNPDKYNDVVNPNEPGICELVVAKHRNGETGNIKMRWVPEYTLFVDPDKRLEKRDYGDAVKVVPDGAYGGAPEISDEDLKDFNFDEIATAFDDKKLD